jgi:hypothetical protein
MRHLHRPSPSLIVAVAAVLVAGTGSAVAATVITSKQIKNGTVQLVDLSKATRDALQGGRGPQGGVGPAGPAGASGSSGTSGSSLPTVLTSGQTLIGAFGNIGFATGASQRFGSAISFPIPLASAPTAHFIRVGGPAVAECAGSAAAPTAAAGHLCIYEGTATNVTTQSFEDPVTSTTGSTTRTFGIDVVGFSAAAGAYISAGSWAVTAP